MLKYPIHVRQEAQGFVLSSRDLPIMNSVAHTKEEITTEALDGIATAIMIAMGDRESIPLPSEALDDEVLVPLPIMMVMKLRLHNEMVKQNVNKAELVRRLGLGHHKQVWRILSIDQSTRIEALESAFKVLGKELDIVVSDSGE